MRRTAFIACVSLLAGALPAQTTPPRKFADASDGSVKVAVLSPSPKNHEPLRYELSEPAYVAAFVVYPGAGVRLLYPLVNSSERLQGAGYHTDALIGSWFDDPFYSVVLGPRLDGPVYLYVIASRHPLDVARYVHRPMQLASAVGQVNARSFYADVAFDAIVNNAVSLGDEQSWDADVYMLWPKSATERQLARDNTPHLRYVACANGTTQAVPDNYPFAGCPGDVRVRPVVSPKPPVQQTASAKAPTTSAPSATGGAANLVVGANSPTVLPTIIGKRPASPDRGTPAIGADASGRVSYTAANGAPPANASTNAPEKVTYTRGVAPGVQLEVTDRSRIERAHRRQLEGHDARPTPMNGQVVGGNPRLAPNPQLAPNPRLAPAPVPAANSAPARAAAPRGEAEQRQVRESLRNPPASSAPAHAAPPSKPNPSHDR
jgi:hypothetical protein